MPGTLNALSSALARATQILLLSPHFTDKETEEEEAEPLPASHACCCLRFTTGHVGPVAREPFLCLRKSLPRTGEPSAETPATEEGAGHATPPRDAPGRGRAAKESANIFYSFQLFSWMQKQHSVLFAKAVLRPVPEQGSETGTTRVSLASGSPPGPACGWQPRSPSSRLGTARHQRRSKQSNSRRGGKGSKENLQI